MGLAAGGRFPPGQVVPYIVAQVVGAIIAAAILYAIASGTAEFSLAKGFAANGYGDHSPGKYSLVACLIAEVVLTMMFLFIIMGSTHGKAPAGFAPIAIGRAARVPRSSSAIGRSGSCGYSGSRPCSAGPPADCFIAG